MVTQSNPFSLTLQLPGGASRSNKKSTKCALTCFGSSDWQEEAVNLEMSHRIPCSPALTQVPVPSLGQQSLDLGLLGGLALKTLVLGAFQKDAGMEILEKCWSVVRRKDL